ncbi:hypothetical protein HZB96_05265 [Candidatus Gottesmanbacteria bacterium]|nr:hypothetical protein [Candidatus Gottesmanbacteria bacterium]
MIDLYKDRPHKWKASWRYTYVNGNYYLGIMKDQEELIGLKSDFPFVGRFNFPFKVLTRFKTLPDLDLVSLILQNFINLITHSKINLIQYLGNLSLRGERSLAVIANEVKQSV